jgi:hypothetical protein
VSRPVKPTFLQCGCGSWFRQRGTKASCTPCSAEIARVRKNLASSKPKPRPAEGATP